MSKSKLPQVQELGISWTTTNKVQDLDKIKIDSVMHAVIDKYNSQWGSIKLNVAQVGDSSSLHFNFDEGKFVKQEGVVAGYIFTTLGLTVVPVSILALTADEFILLFWINPRDRVFYTASLSNDLAVVPNDKRRFYVRSGVLFKGKAKRVRLINEKLSDNIYKLILDLDRQVKLSHS